MGIEEAVLWIGFITGILGAIGFFWQIYQYLTERKEESNKVLNRDVLKPWSDVQLKENYGAGNVNSLSLLVPKQAFPSRTASAISDEGLEIDRLPGLGRGEAYLQSHDNATWSLWSDVRKLMERQRSLRERRTALLEPQVQAKMSTEYPTLKPVQRKDYGPDTYIPENIIAETEATGYYAAKRREIPHAVRTSPTQSGDILYYEFMGNYPLFKVTDKPGEAGQFQRHHFDVDCRPRSASLERGAGPVSH